MCILHHASRVRWIKRQRAWLYSGGSLLVPQSKQWLSWLGFRWFPSVQQVNGLIASQIRSWKLSSTSIQTPYSLIILPINAKGLQYNVFWHAESLLGNDSKQISYTTAVAKWPPVCFYGLRSNVDFCTSNLKVQNQEQNKFCFMVQKYSFCNFI
jgi:hypothetical protein